MRRKTKIIVISSIALTLGLAGAGVGYIFLNKKPGETVGDVNRNDPTLQSTRQERDNSLTIQDYINDQRFDEILYITNNELANQKHWKADGIATAVSVGQKQPITTTRIINQLDDEKYGKEVFFNTMTYSMFQKTAENRYTNNSTYLVWPGNIKSMTEASFDKKDIQEFRGYRPDDVKEENAAMYYFDRYGQTQDGLSNYILNKYTLKESKYLEDYDDGENYTFLYDLSVENVKDGSGSYTSRNAAELYKREVKVLSGNDGFPPFNKAQLQITIDSNFKILSAIAKDSYTVNKPISATVDQTMDITYTYSDSYIEIPNYSDLEEHFGTAESAGGGSSTTQDSALNYLAKAGTNLIEQERININLNLNINNETLPIFLSVKPNMNDLLNSEINVLIGNPELTSSTLYLSYKENGAYFKLNDTEFIVGKQEIKDIINKFIPIDGLLGSFSNMDITSISGMDELLNTAEMKKDEASDFMELTLHLKDLLKSDSFNGINGTAYLGIKDYSKNPTFTYMRSDDFNLGLPILDKLPVQIEFLDNKQNVFPNINTEAAKLDSINTLLSYFQDLVQNMMFKGSIEFEKTIDSTFIKVSGQYQLKVETDSSITFTSNLSLQLNSIKTNLEFSYINSRIYLSLFNSIYSNLTIEEAKSLFNSLRLDELNKLIDFSKLINDLMNNTNASSNESIKNILNFVDEINSLIKDLKISSAINLLDKILGQVRSTSTGIELDLNLLNNVDSKQVLVLDSNNGISFNYSDMGLSLSLMKADKIELPSNLDKYNQIGYNELSTLINIINNIITTKKISLDIQTIINNVQGLGKLDIQGNIVFDFTNSFDFDIKANIISDNFKLNLTLVKKLDKIYLNLGNVNIIVSTSELTSLLRQVEETFKFSLNIDYQELDNLLLSLSDGSNLNSIFNQVFRFINTLNLANTQENSNSNITNLDELLQKYLQNLSFNKESNSISIDNDLLKLVFTSNDSLKVQDIIKNTQTLDYQSISNLINKLNVAFNDIMNSTTYHLDLMLDSYSLNSQTQEKVSNVTINKATIDVVLPKDKLSISRDQIKFHAYIEMSAIKQTHTIDLIYDGSKIYVIYNQTLKAFIGIDEALKLVRYITTLAQFENPILDVILSSVESGTIDGSIFDDLIKPSETVCYDINKLINKVAINGDDINIGIDTEQLLGVQGILDMNLNIGTNSINSLSTTSFRVGENSYLDFAINFDRNSFSEIVSPTDLTNYTDFSSIETLVKAFADTSAVRNFHINGNLSFKLGLKGAEIADISGTFDINIHNDEQGRPTVHLHIYFNNSGINGSNCEAGEFDLFFRGKLSEDDPLGNKLYMSRWWESGVFFKEWKEEYRTLDLDTGKLHDHTGAVVEENRMVGDIVNFLLQPADALKGIINSQTQNSSTTIDLANLKIEQMFKSYTSDTENDIYTLSMDITPLISLVNEISVSIGLNTKSINGQEAKKYINTLNINGELLSNWARASVQGNLVDVGKEVNVEFPSETMGYSGWAISYGHR